MIDTHVLRELGDTTSEKAWELLDGHGLADVSGLTEILTAAENHVWAEPAKSATVARICRQVAETQGWPDLVASARYLEARMQALNGDFDEARQLVQMARNEFLAVDDPDSAMRTGLGLAHVEAMSGDLDQAERILLNIIDDLAATSTSLDLLRARARQNLASIAIVQGRYLAAVQQLEQAEHQFSQLGDRVGVLETINNRAMGLLGLGRVHDATQLVAGVLSDIAGEDLKCGRAELLDTLGRAQMLSGNLAGAIENFETAIETFTELGIAGSLTATKVALADVWLTLNLYSDAATLYGEVADASVSETPAANRAWATLGLGHAILASGDPSQAAQVLSAAREEFVNIGVRQGEVLALLSLSAADGRAGDHARQLAFAQEAKRASIGAELPVEELLVEFALADAIGDEFGLQPAEALADRLGIPSLQSELELRQGLVLGRMGRTEEAKQRFRSCIALVEQLRGTLVSERHRRSFLTSRLVAHKELIRLLLVESNKEAVAEAFAVAESARARALVDAMASLVAEPGSHRPDPEDLVNSAQMPADTQARNNELLGDEELRGIRPLSPRLSVLASAADLNPGAVHLGGASVHDVASIDELQAALAADHATFVSYHHSDDKLIAFVLTPEDLRVVDLPSCRDDVILLLRQLDAQVTRFRIGPGFVDKWADRLESSINTVLAALHTALLAPLNLPASDGNQPSRLVIVPTDPLHGVPFHALRSTSGYVTETTEVVVSSSGSAWLQCRTRRAAAGMSKVFALPDPSVPRIKREGVTIAQTLDPVVDLVMNERASRSHLLGVIQPRVMHVACHGMFQHANGMFSSLRLTDGAVTAHELARTDLQGSLVTLSACESARESMQLGEESMGFPRALLIAGARDIVASGWLAHDEATTMLMTAFYKHIQGGVAPAGALRLAQLVVRETYSHPFYWAAFSVIGAGFEGRTAEPLRSKDHNQRATEEEGEST